MKAIITIRKNDKIKKEIKIPVKRRSEERNNEQKKTIKNKTKKNESEKTDHMEKGI